MSLLRLGGQRSGVGEWVPWSASGEVLQSVAGVMDRPVEGWGRVVVIRGPSGSGRGAILQQIYEWIARQQTPPSYWPPTLTDPRQYPEDIDPRDVVAPGSFSRSEGDGIALDVVGPVWTLRVRRARRSPADPCDGGGGRV